MLALSYCYEIKCLMTWHEKQTERYHTSHKQSANHICMYCTQTLLLLLIIKSNSSSWIIIKKKYSTSYQELWHNSISISHTHSFRKTWSFEKKKKKKEDHNFNLKTVIIYQICRKKVNTYIQRTSYKASFILKRVRIRARRKDHYLW
jgi:hypothetical protein